MAPAERVMVANGIGLESMTFPSDSGRYVVFHNPGFCDYSGYLRFARELSERGWTSILYNPRGIRNSTGLYHPEDMVRDDINLVRMLTEYSQTVIGIGVCLGSYIQSMAQADHFAETGNPLYDKLFRFRTPDGIASRLNSRINGDPEEHFDRLENAQCRETLISYVKKFDRLRKLFGLRGRFVEGENGSPDRFAALNIPQDSYVELLRSFSRARDIPESMPPAGIIDYEKNPASRLAGKVYEMFAILFSPNVHSFLTEKEKKSILSRLDGSV
ncbi:hypothetical protein HY638_01740 [Candidatus Woesearchaeota archaeon]|nr:hypothetical protein [Candidatus Woesearchaeota archaeon]